MPGAVSSQHLRYDENSVAEYQTAYNYSTREKKWDYAARWQARDAEPNSPPLNQGGGAMLDGIINNPILLQTLYHALR